MQVSQQGKLKRPAFQFYPADWRKDTALQFCSLAAQGLWINVMCIAHECENYGHLSVNGKPMTAQQIGRLVGITAKECAKLLDELSAAGVCSSTADGVIYSRRMVRDEELRNRRASGGAAGAEHGQKGASSGVKGGRPKKAEGGQENPPSDEGKGGFEPPMKPPIKPPPSSSSSSSSVDTLEVLRSEQCASGPETAGFQPTARGLVGQAIKRAGIAPASFDVADPRITALLAQGATPEEFEAVAREAVARQITRPLGWICTALVGRRAEAARLSLTPAQPSKQSALESRNTQTAARLAERFAAKESVHADQ